MLIHAVNKDPEGGGGRGGGSQKLYFGSQSLPWTVRGGRVRLLIHAVNTPFAKTRIFRRSGGPRSSQTTILRMLFAPDSMGRVAKPNSRKKDILCLNHFYSFICVYKHMYNEISTYPYENQKIYE